jgi:hypothetical protein
MHSTWLKALFTLALPVVWLTGCGGSSSRITVPVAGGQSVSLERHGSGFKQAENDRVIISNPVLQAVNLDGNYYMRWNFTILPKQAQTLSLIHIEEVSDAAPLTLVNDVAPQLEGGKWTENAGLIPVSSTNIRWLYEPKESLRLFRFTISEPDGRSYVLYQGAQYSPSSKEALRGMVR